MVELTKENFEAEVEQAEGYIFIDFTATAAYHVLL